MQASAAAATEGVAAVARSADEARGAASGTHMAWRLTLAPSLRLQPAAAAAAEAAADATADAGAAGDAAGATAGVAGAAAEAEGAA